MAELAWIQEDGAYYVTDEAGDLITLDGVGEIPYLIEPPTGLSVNPATGLVTWDAVALVSGYQLYRRNGPDAARVLVASPSANQYSDTPVGDDDHRAYQVASVDAATGAPGPPSPPVFIAGKNRKLA